MMAKLISRRDFLKGTAAGAFSLAAASVLGTGANLMAHAEEAKYIPGTYTAKAQGLESEVTVTMTFDETSILDVVIDSTGETPELGGRAGPLLEKAILDAQSGEVDAVSGATITSNAVRTAVNDCIAQAKGAAPAAVGDEAAEPSSDSEWLGKAPEIADADVEEEISADVLVIGCGVAGVAAVRAAAEKGAKVIAVDKASGPQCRSGEYAVINGNVQHRWGRDVFTKEDIDQMIDFHMMESSYKCKRSIISKWANNIGEVFDWWVAPNTELYYAEETRSPIPDENAGNFLIPIFLPLPEHYDWRKETFPCYPTSVEFLPNQGVNVNKNMEAAVATGNVEERYGFFAEKLLMENGRCVGAYLRNAKTGKYVLAHADKGVILATGDYSQNDAMVKHFCPDVIENGIMRLFVNVDVEGKMTNTGDGIKLGMWAGAQVQQDHAPMIHHMGGGADLAGVGVMGNAGFLNLDMNGRRFMNEDLPGQQIKTRLSCRRGERPGRFLTATGRSSFPTCLPLTAGPAMWRTMPALRMARRITRPTATTKAPISSKPQSLTDAPSRPTRWRNWFPRCTPTMRKHRRLPSNPLSATMNWRRKALTMTSAKSQAACGRWRTAPTMRISLSARCCSLSVVDLNRMKTATLSTRIATKSPVSMLPATSRAVVSRMNIPSH